MALDIDPGKRMGAGRFEDLQGFWAGYEHDLVVVVLEKFLAIIVENELSCVGVGLEIELLRDKAKRHTRFVPASCQQADG